MVYHHGYRITVDVKPNGSSQAVAGGGDPGPIWRCGQVQVLSPGLGPLTCHQPLLAMAAQ